MRRTNLTDPTFTYDSGEPEGFRAGMYRFGPELGAEKTGASMYEIPTGQSICPYHYEVGEEEWLLVLSGTPTLRSPDGNAVLAPMDCVFFPTGPEGAHAVYNHAEQTARVLMWSQCEPIAVCMYPDSDKLGVFTPDPEVKGNFRRSTKVDYFDGEDGSRSK